MRFPTNKIYAALLTITLTFVSGCFGSETKNTKIDPVDGQSIESEVSDSDSSENETDIRHSADTDDKIDSREPWRSELYPEDWRPGPSEHKTPVLPDFSYAGYHNGEKQLGSIQPESRINVVEQFDADPSGETDSTQPIQAAIDAAESAGGGEVFFPEGLYRVDGRLHFDKSRIHIRGEGPDKSKIYFTKTRGMASKSHLTFRGDLSFRDEEPILDFVRRGSKKIVVKNTNKYSVGDDIVVGWTITEDFVDEHSMADTWRVFNGTWEPFFRRQIQKIEQTSEGRYRLTLDVPLRYPVKPENEASIRKASGYIEEVAVDAIGISNAVGWDEAWNRDRVAALEFIHVKDGWIRNVESFLPPVSSGRPEEGQGSDDHFQSNGLRILGSKRITVAKSRFKGAQNRGGGGNGYLFEVVTSNELLFRDVDAIGGRHNFIQNWGFGTTGCVWLRVESRKARERPSKTAEVTKLGSSEFHHSLAMANLIDSSTIDDLWSAANRHRWSSGAGHTSNRAVFWNSKGDGEINSYSYGYGFVIGTRPSLDVKYKIRDIDLGSFEAWEGTEPEDWVEGLGKGQMLRPQSLYESQLQKRLTD